MTVGQALAWGIERLGRERRRDVELLLRNASGWNRAFVLTHEDSVLSEESRQAFCGMIERRTLDEPVQYILGKQELWGLEFAVSPAVLIPRPETEHLVEAVLERVSKDELAYIADVGTGSGALAIALATELPRAKFLATDVSSEALEVARANAARLGALERIEFTECDLLPSQLRGELDVVVSNPPYVADTDRETLAREVREFEPAAALFAGADGLHVYRKLVPAAWQAIRPGGLLVLEIGLGQAARVRQLLEGWDDVIVKPDLQGIARVVVARKHLNI